MDRKLKLAAVSLVALTASACAPNPYLWSGGTSAGAYNGNRSTAVAPAGNAVTHTHCGRTHTHVLPPEGLAHQHGDGCMAGSGGAVNTTPPQAYSYNPPPASNTYYNPPPANNTYYNPPPATTSSSTYGYPDQGSTSYYNYTAPATSTSGSNTTGNYNEYSAPKVSASTSSSTYGPAPSTASSYTGSNSYVVQKGDTVFQVMRNTGIYWKDIIRLNNLQAPNYSISAGQTLKLR